MSYTITDDGDVIQIRASIHDRVELKELVATLQVRLDGHEADISSHDPKQPKPGEA